MLRDKRLSETVSGIKVIKASLGGCTHFITTPGEEEGETMTVGFAQGAVSRVNCSYLRRATVLTIDSYMEVSLLSDSEPLTPLTYLLRTRLGIYQCSEQLQTHRNQYIERMQYH